MNKYKLICIDIDGTLINDNKEISVSTKFEIERITKHFNVQIAFVSSRMPTGIDNIALQLNINQPIVCYNGALVLDAKIDGNRPVLFNESIPFSLVKQILSEINIEEVYIGLYRYDEWIIQKADYWSEREVKSTNCNPMEIDFIEFFNKHINDNTGAHKIMFREKATILNKYEEILRLNYSNQVTIHRIKDTVLEITPKNINKADGIKVLCKKFGYQREEIIAFGDNHNDIELFEFAGTSFAMENSPADLKELATEITNSNNEEGVSVILKKYFK